MGTRVSAPPVPGYNCAPLEPEPPSSARAPITKRFLALIALALSVPSALPAQVLPSRTNLQIVPHIVAGDGFVTRVSVVNLSNRLNPVVIHRINQSGLLLRASSEFLLPGGRFDFVTPESQRFSASTIEWMAVGSDSPVGVNVFFELKGRLEPAPITAVGFNGQNPTQQLTFPVAFNPGQPHPLDAGFALANVSSRASVVQLRLRDSNGVLRAESTIQLPVFGQRIFVLSATPPFDGVLRSQPPFLGTLGIIATEPLAAIGVGVDFGPFFALPPFEGAFPFSASGPSSFVAFVPHIVNGTGFQTFLTLLNLSAADNPVEIDFFDQSGAPAQPLPGVVGPFVLGPGATRLVSTGETSRFGPTQIRWARVRSSFPLGANIFFDLKHVAGGPVITSVGFNASNPLTQIVLPVQLAPPLTTEPLSLGIALANVSSQSTSIAVRLLDVGGTVVAQSTRQLPPNGQTAFGVSQLSEIAAFLQRQPNFIGSLAIESTQPVVALGVGDDFGPFFAVPPLAPSTTPIVVIISPTSVTLSPGATQQFSAAVSGTANQAVVWSVNDIVGGNSTLGTISTTGLYIAPAIIPSQNRVSVRATSLSDPSKSAAATVTIPTVLVVAARTIGPEGGIVEVTNPIDPLFGVRVEIPAGALAEPRTITINSISPAPELPSGLARRGPVVEFGPSGLTFSLPVTITLPSTSTFSPNQSDLIYEFAGGVLPGPNIDSEAESHGQILDPPTNHISYLTDHFSPRGRLGDVEIESSLQGAQPEQLTELRFDDTRCNCPSRESIEHIVIHSTHDKPGTTFPGLVTYAARADTKQKGTFAHYYIGKEGQIIQIAPDNREAPHTRGTLPDGTRVNKLAIGIELFAPKRTAQGGEQFEDYTEAQLRAARKLTGDLMRKHGIPAENVRRHKDFARADDADHQDPFGWSNSNWDSFKSQLPSILPPTVTFSWTFFFLPGSSVHYSVITATASNGPPGGTVQITSSWGTSAVITLNASGQGTVSVRTPDHTGCFAGSVSAFFGGRLIGSISESCF